MAWDKGDGVTAVVAREAEIARDQRDIMEAKLEKAEAALVRRERQVKDLRWRLRLAQRKLENLPAEPEPDPEPAVDEIQWTYRRGG